MFKIYVNDFSKKKKNVNDNLVHRTFSLWACLDRTYFTETENLLLKTLWQISEKTQMKTTKRGYCSETETTVAYKYQN